MRKEDPKKVHWEEKRMVHFVESKDQGDPGKGQKGPRHSGQDQEPSGGDE